MTDTMGSRTDTVSELGSPGSPSSRPTISVLKTQRSVTGGTVFSKSKGSDITDTGDDHSATYVGCLSWNVEIINGRIHDRKTIYIDPWKGILFQQGQHSQKSWEVSHIEEATYISENSINVIIKHPSDILSKARIFSFPYGSHAAHFKNAIQQVNEFGEFLRIAYRSIVRSDHGHITKTLLFKALCEHDISVTEEEVESM